MKNEKCLLIIPYFGRFNNYFQLFLNSIADKTYFDFLIITDDLREFIYPQNVRRLNMTFEEMKDKIHQCLGQTYPIPSAQKLCDYRPAYGHLFEAEVRDYAYWGYCDNDCIYGDLDKLVAPLMQEGYDKIFNLGHLTLIKNTEEQRYIYQTARDAQTGLLPVFSSEEGMKFDEELGDYSVNHLFIKANKSIYSQQLGADIYTKANRFYLDTYDFAQNQHQVTKEESLFIYDKGHVYQLKLVDGQLVRQEFAYIHLQKRQMALEISTDAKSYKMIGNAFQGLEYPVETINAQNFPLIKKSQWTNHYFKLRGKNLKTKTKRWLKTFKERVKR